MSKDQLYLSDKSDYNRMNAYTKPDSSLKLPLKRQTASEKQKGRADRNEGAVEDDVAEAIAATFGKHLQLRTAPCGTTCVVVWEEGGKERKYEVNAFYN